MNKYMAKKKKKEAKTVQKKRHIEHKNWLSLCPGGLKGGKLFTKA